MKTETLAAPPSETLSIEPLILTAEALGFLERLHERFAAEREALLLRRARRMADFDAGSAPDFLPETEAVRNGDWRVAPIPNDLQDRRVEITGPTDRKMIINALNSGASVFMADLEDSTSPTWENVIRGQLNLRDAVRRTIELSTSDGKQYRLNEKTATLLVRPRGWHLDEKHLSFGGRSSSAALVDFGLYFFHNARELLARGSGPYFYLPKLESHLEARLWNQVFEFAQDELALPRGSIRATVLIETIPAAFEMDEILYELREHSAGLNCGRWDYIFSIIKKFSGRNDFVLPDRALVTMTSPCMRAYSLLAIKTCHRRGIHAIGGMAAQIPIKNDPEANARAMEKVRADKLREVTDGHDGTWVAHPGLVPLAREIFDTHMPEANQIARQRDDVAITRSALLRPPTGEVTEDGVRLNVDVAIQYMAAWLGGNGCVPIYNLMEDAATAEISRSQLWQWLHHGARLDDGRLVTPGFVQATLRETTLEFIDGRRACSAPPDLVRRASRIIEQIVLNPQFTDFMTSVGYEELG